MKSLRIVARVALAIGLCQAAAFAGPKKVLLLYGIGERPHGPVQQTVIKFMQELSQEHGFALTSANNQDAAENIKDYDLVVFNSTAWFSFTKPAIQQKIQDYMVGGGKAIGFHSTLDIRGEKWTWWVQEMGSGGSSYADDFIAPYTMDLDPEIAKNPALKEAWVANSLGDQIPIPKTEVYVFNYSPRGKAGVTMLLTVNKAHTDVVDHPFGWLKKVGQGEFLYTAIGHEPNDFSSGWGKKATWAWMKYLAGDYNTTDALGKHYEPFARIVNLENSLHVKDNGPHSVRVYNLQGRLLHQWSGMGENAHSFQGLETGVYYLRVRSEHLNHTRRITIQ